MAAAQRVLLVALLASLFAPLAKAGPMTPVVVATTSALIFAGQNNDSHLNPLLFRPSIFLGNISYSLSLWHWSILDIARSLGLNQGGLNEVAIVIVCLVVGYASYRYIENPFRHANWGGTNASILGKGIAIPAVLISAIAIPQRLILSINPAQQQELFQQQSWIGSTKKACHVSVVTQASIGNNIAQCKTLAPNRRHAIITGNSNSEPYTPAIRAALPGWDVDQLTLWGCSYEPSAATDERSKQKGCHIHGKEVKKYIETNISANSKNPYLNPGKQSC
jgi:hypothetical protein